MSCSEYLNGRQSEVNDGREESGNGREIPEGLTAQADFGAVFISGIADCRSSLD